MILGDNIYLRLMEKKDLKFKVRWVNDPDVRKTLFISHLSEVGSEQWLSKVALDPTREDFVICKLKDDVPIGFSSVVNIDFKNSKAETYLCIGDKNFWGKGYGTEVKMLLLKYVFMELGLNRVYSYNWSENKNMIKVNEKLGFTVEGVLREDVFSQGQFKDRVLFSMLRNDYLEKS